MKTWVTYLTALVMGFATCLLFGNYTVAADIFASITDYLVGLSVFIFIPVILITFSAGVASLSKDSVGRKAAKATVSWTISTTVLLAAAGAAIYYFFPSPFPVTSSAGGNISVLEQATSYSLSNAASQLYPINPFLTIANISYIILPLVLISWILGLSLRPSADVIRPAYTTMNSFAEVMYRISRTTAIYGAILVYCSSTYFFLALYQEKTVLAVPSFLKMLVISTFAILFIAIPVIYGCFTGFKKNPYRVFSRSISNLTIALTTGNILAASLVSESVARQNLGVQKRIASTTIPVMSMITRGGTAFISTLASLMLIEAATGSPVPIQHCIGIAGAIMAVSIFSTFFTGQEVIFVCYLAIGFCGINLGGAEVAIIALLPLLNGLAALIDSFIINLGAVVAACNVGTDIAVSYDDTL